MPHNAEDIRYLLQQKADLQARINLIPYDGSPEVKENKSGRYLYMRKRIAGKLTSTYVDVYSDDLYQLLLRNAKELRELRKALRKVHKELADLGYASQELAPLVVRNLDFARANMKTSIYDQAILEGVATTFPQTEDIIDNGTVNGMTASDIEKVLNLKHAWEFILDADVLQAPSDFSMLSHIAELVNEGFYTAGGRVRVVPVAIGSTTYVPPLPDEVVIKEHLMQLCQQSLAPIDVAIQLCLYVMKTQIFIDGNKRAAVIYANHYLVAHGGGLLTIPWERAGEFKKRLVAYYEDETSSDAAGFLKKHCWQSIQ